MTQLFFRACFVFAVFLFVGFILLVDVESVIFLDYRLNHHVCQSLCPEFYFVSLHQRWMNWLSELLRCLLIIKRGGPRSHG